jgi:transcriptional regulator with XRE-family HTH domain
MTFGQLIADARKKANLSQKELAALLKKEDGQPISPQYLNDIEHDRRNPPSEHLIQQLAEKLDIEPDLLYFYARQLPADIPTSVEQGKVIAAYKAFRRELERK